MQDLSSTRVFEGFLDKKGAINKSWKHRYFVLYNGRRLAYFEDKKSTNAIKEIDLSEVTAINIVPTKEEKTKIKLEQKQRSQTKENISNHNNNNNNHNNNDSDSDEMDRKQNRSGSSNTIDKINTTTTTISSNSPQMGPITTSSSLTISPTNDDAFRRQSSTMAKSGTSDRARSFELVTPKRTYLLSCRDDKLFREWVEHLERVIFGRRVFSGWLIKRGAYRKNWKKRWFVVFDTQEMRYYDNESSAVPRGLIKLHEVLLMCPGDEQQYTQPNTIQLMTPDRNWVLATDNKKERDIWFSQLEEVIHGAKRLITSHEGYLWRRKGNVVKSWKKRYFALSKGWLFYFEEEFYCNKFKSIAFFSEAFFHQAFQLYVKGSIPLNQTTIQKVDVDANNNNNDPNQQNNSNNKQQSNNNGITNSTTILNDMSSPASTTTATTDTDASNNNGENISKQHVFKITTDKKEFFFACDSENELNKWFKAFHHIYSNDYNMNGGGTPTGSQDSQSMWTAQSSTGFSARPSAVGPNTAPNSQGGASNVNVNIANNNDGYGKLSADYNSGNENGINISNHYTNDSDGKIDYSDNAVANNNNNNSNSNNNNSVSGVASVTSDDEKLATFNNNNNNNSNNKNEKELGGGDTEDETKIDRNTTQSSFFDLIDPNHNAKWIDIENDEIIEQQGRVTRKSILEHEKLSDTKNTNNNINNNNNNGSNDDVKSDVKNNVNNGDNPINGTNNSLGDSKRATDTV